MPRNGHLALSASASLGLFSIHRYRFLTIDQFARVTGLHRTTAADKLRLFEQHGMLGHFGNQGFDPHLNAFVQSYGSQELDASLLLLPLVGFLPAADPRVRGTVAAIERHLLRDGLVHRYTSTASVDGLPPGEGAFLACTFWLADTYMLLGRDQDARRLFERLLALRNDVGLLSEEYDLQAQRLVGNFPQALSHIGLVTTALNLSPQEAAPAEQRQQS
jgi:GH15 family glucan-1,4-alpha-glucosidase